MPIDHTHINPATTVNIVQHEQTLSPVPLAQSLTWENWSGNNQFTPDASDGLYYFTPDNLEQLQQIIKEAANKGKKIRVSGQRHSITPLVINNNSDISTTHGNTWVIDLACYSDLGADGNSNIVLDRDNDIVTVNSGVSETDLDAFLSAHNYRLNTVTAGGFFSLGGMTAVDVHGSAVNASIFADSVIAYSVINDDGVNKTYDIDSPDFQGISPLQFFRTSLGTLGVVSSVTLKISPRAYKNTLVPSHESYSIDSKKDFVDYYKNLLFSGKYDSVESFYNPYGKTNNFLALLWRIDPDPKTPIINKDANDSDDAIIYTHVNEACDKAQKRAWGAPILPLWEEKLSEMIGIYTQNNKQPYFGKLAIDTAMETVKSKMKKVISNNDALWLDQAERVVFSSYFIPLPDDTTKAMETAWDALKVISNQLQNDHNFVAVLPPEFRFVRGSDALLSGTYSNDKTKLFISIEILALVQKGSVAQYPQNVLDYFANIEHKWVAMGGFPHHGKMYGFYNPDDAVDGQAVKGVTPFNSAYIKMWKKRKANELALFSRYQKQLDPNGLFCNRYTNLLGLCSES
ncbi:MAG: FAD-binding protein [Francisellaceae bacterium]